MRSSIFLLVPRPGLVQQAVRSDREALELRTKRESRGVWMEFLGGIGPKLLSANTQKAAICQRGLVEAAIGFEPMHRGFADLSLTTWVRRPVKACRLEAALPIMPARTHQLKRNNRRRRTGFSPRLRAERR